MGPTWLWSRIHERAARSLARKLLAGVGNGVLYEGFGRMAYHLRTPLSAGERAELSPEWLSCPATDVAGELLPTRPTKPF